MLRVTIHAGEIKDASVYNRLAWLELAYERAGAVADYKVLYFANGEGALPPFVLKGYPRWSASLWDLVGRATAMALSPEEARTETIAVVEAPGKRWAFASALCAIIEYPPSKETRHGTLATLQIRQDGRRRGWYRAWVTEDTRQPKLLPPFEFRPKRLIHAELMLHAVLVLLTGGQAALPKRPGPVVPPDFREAGVNYVPIARLPEPARSGFVRWLDRYADGVIHHERFKLGIAPATLYRKFIEEVT